MKLKCFTLNKTLQIYMHNMLQAVAFILERYSCCSQKRESKRKRESKSKMALVEFDPCSNRCCKKTTSQPSSQDLPIRKAIESRLSHGQCPGIVKCELWRCWRICSIYVAC